ncbi:MAG: hypothetical protein R2688_05545 [Fimbriimonadaceae bacterium]
MTPMKQTLCSRSESWVKPPEPLLSAIMAPWHENWTTGSVDPTNSRMLITRDEGTIPLERLGRRHAILGGLAPGYEGGA